eukprot:scaffold19153_cov80-Skeletonema_menzelii.AAC.12
MAMEEFEERVMSEASVSISTKSRSRQRAAAKLTLLILPLLFALQTVFERWMKTGAFQTLNTSSAHKKKYNQTSFISQPLHQRLVASYTISNDVRQEYARWHSTVRNLSQMNLKQPNWEPLVDWKRHPRDRSERFPSVAERVQYYMGKWYNTTIPMYGKEFERATFIQRKTTREYGPFSDILVNLYNLDKFQLYNCFKNKKELHVMSPYCRDYIDIAILHQEGSANIIHNVGDGLPTYLPDELKQYPMFAKVRPNCSYETCRTDKIESILLPLNRHRHFGVASVVPENDISFDEKIAKAVWRGKFGKTHDTMKDTNDVKFALVSRHVNSTTVDAKFSKHTKGAPPHMIGSYLDVKEQLKYKYIISIEGNDVSSGLKWMLFSNSVVLMPKPTWESWTMEAMLEEFVHYLPIKRDCSNVEEMIQWAQDHPEETRMIAERSTLFIYDLLFHPEANKDEQNIMISIMERFENNFGCTSELNSKHPLDVNWKKHPTDRASRFPSVEERVEYIMNDWFNNTSSIHIEPTTAHLIKNNMSSDDLFISSGRQLSDCAMLNSSYSDEIRQLCQESLPAFDDRVTADLKSNSFARLRASEKGDHLRLASISSWRTDSGGTKESKRVFLNDATKIVYFGEDPCKTAEVPFFTRSRGSISCKGNGILWPFGFDTSTLELVKSGLVEKMDTDFEQKKPEPCFITGSTFSKTIGIDAMLLNRYLVREEKDPASIEVIFVMMLSKSVVLMPEELQSTSWLMESYLEPYLHFVPVDFTDPSDLKRKIQWCEENLNEARMISERGTLFVHDLLFHRKAERDDEEVRFRVMERYDLLYGGKNTG